MRVRGELDLVEFERPTIGVESRLRVVGRVGNARGGISARGTNEAKRGKGINSEQKESGHRGIQLVPLFFWRE